MLMKCQNYIKLMQGRGSLILEHCVHYRVFTMNAGLSNTARHTLDKTSGRNTAKVHIKMHSV